jgi:translation initiation factor 1A
MFKEHGQEIIRVRTPQKGEILGLVMSMLGGGRLEAKCEDGNKRICRIPGKIKKKIWVRTGDLILIKPWIVQSNERGDVIWMYSKAQAIWLRNKGFVKSLSSEM